MPIALVTPDLERLPGYACALRRGWSPDNVRGEAARERLAAIEADAAGFVASLTDAEARGAPIALPDGSRVPRLPGLPDLHRWIWDGAFRGSIGLRWQPGTAALPPHVLGHIGYAVVPWKRGRGYARQALSLLLPEAAALGLPYVEITTAPGNVASQRVIEGCGGWLVERFREPPTYGGAEALRYRIELAYKLEPSASALSS